MIWIGFIFGTIGIAFNFSIYQQKTRKKLLLTKLIANCCWTLHYAFLSAWSGAAICSIGVLRESVFLNNHRKWAKSKLWLLLFVILGVVSAVLTWENPYSILPLVASVLSIYSFWRGNPTLTKILSLPISTCFLTYNIAFGSFIGIANEIFVLASTMIALIKICRKTYLKRKNGT